MNYVQCDPPMVRPGAHRHDRQIWRLRRLRDGLEDEDFLAVPLKVLSGGGLGAFGQEYHLAQWWFPVILPGQLIGLDGVGERPREVDAQSAVDGEHAGVECDVVGGACGQAVSEVEALGRCAVLPWLDMAS